MNRKKNSRPWRPLQVVYVMFVLFWGGWASLTGEPGLPGEGGYQPEPGGAQQPDVRGRSAPDLHTHAQRLLPTFPQLVCLQGPPGTKEGLPGYLRRFQTKREEENT